MNHLPHFAIFPWHQKILTFIFSMTTEFISSSMCQIHVCVFKMNTVYKCKKK